MVLPYVSWCISVVFMCVCMCVCMCMCVCACVCVCVHVCVCVCASDVLKNCTVPFAQRIHMHMGV